MRRECHCCRLGHFSIARLFRGDIRNPFRRDQECFVMTYFDRAELVVFEDARRLADGVAKWLFDIIATQKEPVAIALSGGSTPRPLYECLSEPPYRDTFPWTSVHWFWGDERFVPHNDPRSNYRMANEALLSRVPIPADHIHPIATENTTPDAAAADYEHAIKAFYGSTIIDPRRPIFYITLLGLGEDGHTASLFPGTDALAVRDRLAVAVRHASEPRITLTYPALESSRHVAFLVTGKEKQTILSRVILGQDDLPALRLHPSGRLTWFVDRSALSDDPMP